MIGVSLSFPLPLDTQLRRGDAVVLSSEGRRRESHINRLPTEILQLIFINVIELSGGKISSIPILSSVCWLWHEVCQHAVMWEYVTKKIFVAYPLVQRLHQLPLSHSEIGLLGSIRCCGALVRFIESRESGDFLIAPSNQTLHNTMEEVKHYLGRRSYYKYVQRRRVFVLHLFLSGTLLSFSLFLFSTACVNERLFFGNVCNPVMAFFFLWVTYFLVFATVIANVVMETHFEPKPLIYRLKKKKPLIIYSSVAVLVFIFCVILPTWLVQNNFFSKKRFAWLWCGAAPILSLCLWQIRVIFLNILPGLRRQLYEQRNALWLKSTAKFLVVNFPNVFPMLLAGAIFGAFQHVESGGHLYVVIGVLPLLASLVLLTFLFLLDFCLARRITDLIISVSLFLVLLFPLSLLKYEFRGLNLFPVTIASFFFFFAHLKLVAVLALKELLDGAHSCSNTR